MLYIYVAFYECKDTNNVCNKKAINKQSLLISVLKFLIDWFLNRYNERNSNKELVRAVSYHNKCRYMGIFLAKI